MFLFDVYSFNAENHEAVGVARRLVFTIRTVMGHVSLSLFLCFSALPSTAPIGSSQDIIHRY